MVILFIVFMDIAAGHSQTLERMDAPGFLMSSPIFAPLIMEKLPATHHPEKSGARRFLDSRPFFLIIA
ncbi:MAG TPA: hypothetical protein P5055_17545 [Candidatus Paceibacterota bacterium]|nr:hypothetical protein [Candidatus Paceibacterota bacterium]